MRAIDLAHAAAAEEFLDPVSPVDDLARRQGVLGRDHRILEKVAGLLELAEQVPHLRQKCVVAGAGFKNVGLALVGRAIERGVEDLRDLGPDLAVHRTAHECVGRVNLLEMAANAQELI